MFAAPVRNSGRRGWRIGALLGGACAALMLVIVGCTSVTDGSATGDAKEAPAYRTSVSVSMSESRATSSQREASRQSSMTTAAIRNSCEALSTSSVTAIREVNVWVAAYNDRADTASKEGPAIKALNDSADLVEKSLSPSLSPELTAGLREWIDSARNVAGAISRKAGPDEFNAAVKRLNEAKTNALKLCQDAY